MMRVTFVAAVAGTAVFSASASAAELTPAGPASLTVGFGPNVACPLSYSSQVLTAWRVVVGEGGQAGTVRPTFGSVVGDPVDLPAAPGTYTFPAPHIDWQGCGDPGLIQETGDHAVLVPEDSASDRHVLVVRDGQDDERIEGRHLTVTGVVEPDIDRDLRGDVTEDRTDLKLTAAPTRDAVGRLVIPLTITNAGPLPADRPLLHATVNGTGRWQGDCWQQPKASDCLVQPIAPGASRTITYYGDAPSAQNAEFSVSGEGPDLQAGDNTALFAFGAAQAFDLSTPAKQRLASGVKLTVLGAQAQRARVSIAFTVRGKPLKLGRVVKLKPFAARTVTIKPTGAKLRSLRRAAAKGALSAVVTVRTFSGKTPVTAKTTVLR